MKSILDQAFDDVAHIPLSREVSYKGMDALVIAREVSFKKKEWTWKITLHIISSGRQVICKPSEVKERKMEKAVFASYGIGL